MSKINVEQWRIPMKKLLLIYRWTVALSIMMFTGTISLVLVLLSFGLLRNFCVKYIIKYSSRLILFSLGYKYKIPSASDFSDKKHLYTFNHSSYLDIFLLTSIGIPNTRFFLSEKVFKYIPLVISAKAIGTFFIPQQFNERRRLDFFIKRTEFFRKHNYSLMASAEGVHDKRDGIARFNRGVFHLAKEAELDVVMLYINLPQKINPYRGEYAEAGFVEVDVIGAANPSEWEWDNLRVEIDKVRDVYVEKYDDLFNNYSK